MNNKLGKVTDAVDSFKEDFNGEDFEKDKDLERELEDKLDECDRDINGDEAERKAENKALMADLDDYETDKLRSL